MGFENGLLAKGTRQDKSADSPKEVQAIIIPNDDLIRWHRFQTGDDGITAEKSIGRLLPSFYKSHAIKYHLGIATFQNRLLKRSYQEENRNWFRRVIHITGHGIMVRWI